MHLEGEIIKGTVLIASGDEAAELTDGQLMVSVGTDILRLKGVGAEPQADPITLTATIRLR